MAATDGKLLAGPLLILLIMAMLILPLPPFALDLFFTFNIALSLMVLLVSMFTLRALDFSAFPAVLLFTTLLRLALNVASTRVVLMEGHEGGAAAGKVIEAFGQFLVGGNFAVGLVVFLILVVINFMVITKGAGRIAEVGARFMLDAMPGKQMAIDADLNAGLIGEEEAKKRRAEVSQEADFYGSMDGASKFVRGDAVAGLVIMAVNIIGGLIIGMAQHDLSFADAGRTYTLLTIGDGLVAQIPALVISTAAGVTVSRVNTEQDVGQQMIEQLLVNPKVLILAAGVMGLLGLVPGMPNFVFLLFTAALAGAGWYLARRGDRQLAEERIQAEPPPQPEAPEASWDDVQLIDTLGLEVGHRLIPMVDYRQQGELLGRIKSVRKKFAQEVGFLPPVVHIRDNLELGANTYVITLKGAEVGRGEAYPGKWLAIDPGQVSGEVSGTPPGTRRSVCRRCGSRRTSASRPRCTATPWWTPAPWWPPTSTICCTAIPPRCWAVRKCSNCWTSWATPTRAWWRTWCPRRCRSPPCSASSSTCSTRTSRSAICAPSSTPWPNTPARAPAPTTSPPWCGWPWAAPSATSISLARTSCA
ncbi:Flagellar biosynthesis protein FlhA [Alcanivorax sp. ALC70]|nr:Flagellar biosynthesis protein FlhA [Alcanivorax sp. ALC70]